MLRRGLPRRLRPAAAHRQAGFTLIELLVVMVSGMVIALTTFALIDTTIRQTTRTQDRIEAAQRARVFMEGLEQEMNSGCLSPDVSPVQATSAAGISPAVSSDANDIVFVSGLGDGSSDTPVEHVITYANGTITDSSYANTGGSAATQSSASTWTFASTPSSVRTLTNVHVYSSQYPSLQPLFAYYSYNNPSNPNANSLLGAVAFTSSQLPLSSTWPSGPTNAAPNVAQVDINFQVGPSDGSSDPYTFATMNDTVTFRLTPPTSTTTNYPCD